MSREYLKITIAAFIVFAMFGCKQNEIKGIKIGVTLYEHQSYSENKKLLKIINSNLEKDEDALKELVSFPCGGGAGCYDLGFIVTQIIYSVGEIEFIKMVNKVGRKELMGIRRLVSVGLEYGDYYKNGMGDRKRIEIEFPQLNKVLNEKN